MNLFRKKKNSHSVHEGIQIVTASHDSSLNNEQFNSIRTNIKFTNIDKNYKKIMLTSSQSGEGKSSVAANLAVSFAKQGLKTLLVDTDFRRPTIAKTFSIRKTFGFTNLLTTDNFDINQIIYKTNFNSLFVLPSGPVPPNPSELLDSNKMRNVINRGFEIFDLVIFDAPPILPVTDAQILATMVDGVIFVVREGASEKNEVAKSVHALNEVDAHLLGTILNDSKPHVDGYYSDYYK